MRQIGLWYGTTTGNTAEALGLLRAAFALLEIEIVEYDIGEAELSDMTKFEHLILSCPTWYDGQLQDDWIPGIDKLKEVDLSGKKVALLGLGDQYGYPSYFADALGAIAEVVRERGGQLVAPWPSEGYDFEASKALEDGKFVGLVLDFENQEELNEERIITWSEQVKAAFFE